MAVASGSSASAPLDRLNTPHASPTASSPDRPSVHSRERSSSVKNRKREICTSGSARGEGGNILTYSASRSSTRAVCLPSWAQCPTGGGRGGSAAVSGRPEVVDADLADYFGSIPHAELLKSAACRIVDRRVLHLIKMWLESPVEETDDRDTRHARRRLRTNGAASRKAHRSHHAGEPLHAPVRVGMEDARAGAKPRLSHRDLRRRSCATNALTKEGAVLYERWRRALRGRQSGVDPSHRKLLSSKAMVVSVAETAGHDPVRQG